jgi:hypothetical protein
VNDWAGIFEDFMSRVTSLGVREKAKRKRKKERAGKEKKKKKKEKKKKKFCFSMKNINKSRGV